MNETEKARLAELDTKTALNKDEAVEYASLKQKDVDAKSTTLLLDEKQAGQIQGMINDGLKSVESRLKETLKDVNLSGSVTDTLKLKKIESEKDAVMFFKSMFEGNTQKVNELSKKFAELHFKAAYMNEGTTADGGAIAPPEFSDAVIKYQSKYNKIRSNAKVVTMKRKEMWLNEITADVSVSKVGEGVANTGVTKPTLAEPKLITEKYTGIAPFTIELEDDSEISVLDELTREFARAFNKKEEESFISSTVSGSEGLLTASGVTVLYLGGSSTSGKTGFSNITLDDISLGHTVLANIDDEDAQEAKIYMNPEIYHTLRVLKASTSGVYHMPPVPSSKNPAYIWGLEVVLENQMPKLSATAVSTKFAVIANLQRHFVIGDMRNMAIDLLKEGTINSGGTAINLAQQGMKALRAIKRTAQKVVLADGVICLSTSAS